MEKQRPVRVAIVGSGMAGLVTAYLLQRDAKKRYAVKVFESGTSLSLDSASVSIPNEKNQGHPDDRVDLPMRAFAGGYYSNLKAMYDHLGVKYANQPFLFEFAEDTGREGEADRSYFLHASNLHRLHVRRSLSYLAETVYLIVCYAWFSLCCFFVEPRTLDRRDEKRGGAVSETLDQYLRRIGLPQYFITYYLLPLMSSVATCPHQALLAFPATDVVNYKKWTHRAPHYTVSNGVKTVQEKLSQGVEYELSAAVTAVVPHGNQVRIHWQKAGGDSPAHEDVFDRVVLAVTPDVVGRVFAPLQYPMSRIPTTEVESVVHTDRRTLECAEGESEGDDDDDDESAQLIYLRTCTDGTHRTESLHVQACGAIVTTCPYSNIDPSRTIHSAKFTRVLRSPESKRIVDSVFREDKCVSEYHDEKPASAWRNGDDGVWLVGGWCWDGMVLLEGCVVSATRVARDFDVEVPWLR